MPNVLLILFSVENKLILSQILCLCNSLVKPIFSILVHSLKFGKKVENIFLTDVTRLIRELYCYEEIHEKPNNTQIFL